MVLIEFKSLLIFYVHDIIPKDSTTQEILLSVISRQAHLKDNLSAIKVFFEIKSQNIFRDILYFKN